jgi:broad specificity phosphatase PhoE
MAEVCARLYGLVHGLRHLCPDGRVILVCHGEAIGAFRAKLEQMSQHEYRAWSTDPTEKIANGQIVHYTRRNPEGGPVTEQFEWRRSIVPADQARSKPWERIERSIYDADGLLEAVDEVPRLL